MNDICANRHRGNTASEEAFERARPHASRTRDVIRNFIWANRGVTSEDIQAHLRKMLPHAEGWPLNSFSGRITELKAAELVDVLPALRGGRQVLVRYEVQKRLLDAA